jgi:histidine triad (HIT) family protein
MNVFQKIIDRHIKANVVFETPHTIAIYDINPQARIHILIICKQQYKDWYEFSKAASSEQQSDLLSVCAAIIDNLQLKDYYVRSNAGKYQEVPHIHLHLLAD